MAAAEELEAFTLERAHTIAQNSPLSIRSLQESLQVLTGPSRSVRGASNASRGCANDEDEEGIGAFKEKRKPAFTGC